MKEIGLLRRASTAWMAIFAAIVLALAVAAFLNKNWLRYTPLLSVVNSHSFIESSKAILVKPFFDPNSVQFADVAVYEFDVDLKDGGGKQAVCGKINGKNILGAYVGFMPFYVFENLVEIQDESDKDKSKSFKTMSRIICESKVFTVNW